MILRSFSNHINNADWTAVFIELLVVIVGVYGAFQLERWGEELREGRNERVLLEQLHNEIERAYPKMEEQAHDGKGIFTGIMEVASILMKPVGSGELNDEQCNRIFQVSILSWDPLVLTTLDEMVSNGVHSQLDDRELRALLFSLKAEMRGFDTYMQLVRPQQNLLMDQYPNLLPRGVEDGKRVMICNTDGMRASQGFINHLMSNIGRHNGMVSNLEQELAALGQIHNKLDEVLETSGAEKITLHEKSAEDNP